MRIRLALPRLGAGSAVVLAAAAALAQTQQPAPGLDGRLARVLDAYESIATYEDEGVVETRSDGTPAFESRRTFRTWFDRETGRFRFEFEDPSLSGGLLFHRDPARMVIWDSGDGPRKWWTIKPEVETLPTTGFGLGAAAGVSRMSSTLVAPLLSPRLEAMSILMSAKATESLGSEMVDGVACERIRVEIPGYPAEIELWIGPDDLIRRFRAVQQLGGSADTTTITLTPVAGTRIDDAVFNFTPPPTSGGSATRTLLAILIVGGVIVAVGVWVIARRLLELHMATRDEWSPAPDNAPPPLTDAAARGEPEDVGPTPADTARGPDR